MADQTRFVVRFTGPDLPGLLRTFADPMDPDYNISDISLATGGEKHATFLTCEPVDSNSPSNQWERLKKLEVDLRKAAEGIYFKWYKGKNEVMPTPQPWSIDISLLEGPQTSAFSVFVRVLLLHLPGGLKAVTRALEHSFNIKDSSDSPFLPRHPDDWKSEMNALRVVWLTLEQSTKTDEGGARFSSVEELSRLIRDSSAPLEALKEAAQTVVEDVQNAIHKEASKYSATLMSAHVVNNFDGRPLTSGSFIEEVVSGNNVPKDENVRRLRSDFKEMFDKMLGLTVE